MRRSLRSSSSLSLSPSGSSSSASRCRHATRSRPHHRTPARAVPIVTQALFLLVLVAEGGALTPNLSAFTIRHLLTSCSSRIAKTTTFVTVRSHVAPVRSITSTHNDPTRLFAMGRTSSTSSLFGTPPPRVWSDPHHALAHCIPSLSPTSYKGSSGRVGVLGGSERYTGAPYYAAMSALQTGADLAFVFCAEEAAVPIKCYSPELMVTGVYSAKTFGELAEGDKLEDKETKKLIDKMVSEVSALFDRMHVLIIGPGLGRNPLVLRATARIIELAREANLPLVIDADGLFLLTQDPYKDLVAGYSGVVLTPNAVEYKRLVAAHDKGDDGGTKGYQGAVDGCVVVQKGRHDAITMTVKDEDARSKVRNETMVCEEVGGLKRSGGIGDVLAGALGTFVAWNRILNKKDKQGPETNTTESDGEIDDDLLLSCWSACCVTKRAARKAFEGKRRAMTAPDVLNEIGGVVDDMTQMEPEENGDCIEENGDCREPQSPLL